MAITGPFITTRSSATELYVQHKYKWVGVGRRLAMPYFVAKVQQGGDVTWALTKADAVNSVAATKASNLITGPLLYDKLFSRLGAKAEGLMNLFESRKTWMMVSLRLGQLLSAARFIRQGKAAQAVRSLGVGRHPKAATFVRKWRGNTKQSSKAWLELTFGWAPVANDMRSAVKVFEHEFDTRIRCSISEPYTVNDSQIYFDPLLGRNVGTYVYSSHECKATASAEVRIDNPNAFLANRLGLVNLGSVLWDSIPFSFVLDWFGRFGTYIRSLTDQLGVTLSNAYRGWSTRGSGSCIDLNASGKLTASWRTVGGGRVLGLPPRPDPFDRLVIPQFTPWLAVTSISLLVATLKSLR